MFKIPEASRGLVKSFALACLNLRLPGRSTFLSISHKDFFLPELSVILLWVSLDFQRPWHLSSQEIKKNLPKVVFLWKLWLIIHYSLENGCWLFQPSGSWPSNKASAVGSLAFSGVRYGKFSFVILQPFPLSATETTRIHGTTPSFTAKSFSRSSSEYVKLSLCSLSSTCTAGIEHRFLLGSDRHCNLIIPVTLSEHKSGELPICWHFLSSWLDHCPLPHWKATSSPPWWDSLQSACKLFFCVPSVLQAAVWRTLSPWIWPLPTTWRLWQWNLCQASN